MTPKYKDFLTNELPAKLRTLPGNQPPNFGLMTAHHTVEHLVYVTKSMMKRRGGPEGEPTKSQRYFRQFVDNGCPFEYRPKEDAKLNDLRTTSIEEAIHLLEEANERFYALFASDPTYKSYNAMTGEFDLADLELFFYQHGRWHCYQFGLVEGFEAIQ